LAGAAGIARGSHDDRTVADRLRHRAQGATVVDFPTGFPAPEAAFEAGEAVVMGSPNVVRGRRHMFNGGLAAGLVLGGYRPVLAPDYFYPARPAAAIKLWRQHRLGFGATWDLVSSNPAKAVGLDDRGAIAVGRRADIVLLDIGADAGATPHVVELHVAGR